MKNLQSHSARSDVPNRFLAAFLAAILFSVLLQDAAAATKTWTGGGADNNWTTGANWGGVAPDRNDYLVFPGGPSVDATSLNNTNNYGAMIFFNSITITGTNYILNGDQIPLGDDAVAFSVQSGGLNTVNLPIEFNHNPSSIECTVASGTLLMNGDIELGAFLSVEKDLIINAAGDIQLGGRISGLGDLFKIGSGRLLLNGALNNTYVGTTIVNAGTLELNDTASATEMVPSSVIINGGTLLLTEGNQIADFADVTVNGSGVFNLNGFSETTEDLTINGGTVTTSAGSLTITEELDMTGGTVTTGAGTLTLGSNVWIHSSATTATISGNLSLGGVTRTFNLGLGANLLISARISGTGGAGITKIGGGTLTLSGVNTYTGPTTISGPVILANDSALGANGFSTNGTTVELGAELRVEGADIGNEFLALPAG